MVITLHYRAKREMSKVKFIILDILDAVPILKYLIRLVFKRHDIAPYDLTLNLDKVKTEMFIKNRLGHAISEMNFTEIETIVFDYNKKYESFATYPNMVTFISKRGTQYNMCIPLSKKSDFDNLQRELDLMGIETTNNVHRKIYYIVIAALIVGFLAVYFGGPMLLDYLFSSFNK